MSDHTQETSPPSPESAAQWENARRVVGDGMLSIIMPAHQLGAHIRNNVHHVYQIFDGLLPFEIVVVNDGSQDNTVEELSKTTDELPNVHAVHQETNMGKGAAILRGFEMSRGSHIILLDGDLDLPVEQTARFFDVMQQQDVDIVIGSKLHSGSSVSSYPWHRKLVSLTYYAFVKLLVGLPVQDTQTGLKLFRRAPFAYAAARMLVKSFAFDLELLAIAHNHGYTIAAAPVALQFHATWGYVRPVTIRQIMIDTLAIFYRLRILRYYQNIPDAIMPTPPPLVSIVIAYPRPSPQLNECLAAISAQTYTNYQVILLPDQASNTSYPENTTEIATGHIRPPDKRNIGIKHARGSIVAFLDDDAPPLVSWLKHALVHFSNSQVGAVGGPATTPRSDPFKARMSGEVYANILVSGHYRYRYVPERVRQVEDFPSCNLLVRTSLLRELGGFNTDFWPGEDTHLCLDIVNHHQKIIYDPRVQVLHHRRCLFMPHLRQIARYALHRGFFAKKLPRTSFKISYMLPSLLVIGVIAGSAISQLLPILMPLYLSALGFYLAITFLSCLHRHPYRWLVSWLGVITTHFVYGTWFLAGLCSTRMPSQVAQFDHASESQPITEEL